ncbi:MAG: InlB B-repeat-containing protein, partial [Bacteroides sp.]|nr:InlB B-repeat-containing protein [Bacteroides sp.]
MLKRRLNGKTLGALCMLVMSVFLALFAAVRSDAWEVNPSEYRYDMSLFFSLPEEFENLNKYEIGAFIDDKCCGLAEKVDLDDGVSCLYMRIRSNATNAIVSFKLKNRSTGQVNDIKKKDGTSFTFSSNALVGSPSTPYQELTPYFTVSFSSNLSVNTVKPSNTAMVTLEVDGEDVGSTNKGSTPVTKSVPYGKEIKLKASCGASISFKYWDNFEQTNPYETTVKDNITIMGLFGTSNTTYTITFEITRLDGSVSTISTQQVSGCPTCPPKFTVLDGCRLVWDKNFSSTTVSANTSYSGKIVANTYTATFKIDGEVVATEKIDYDTPLDAYIPATGKEGYKFSGWNGLPENGKMPAYDIVVEGSYSIESFNAVYKIGDEVIETLELEYGADIPNPGVPVIEGHSFDGWKKDYDKMPAHDIEVIGSYSINSYKVTFMVDDKVIETKTLEFGAEVVAPEAPEKEGYVFSEWEGMYLTMPAQDIVVKAVYIEYSSDNHTLTFVVDGKVVSSSIVKAGTPITAPEGPAKEGYSFEWKDLPETMPNHDLTVEGVYTVNSYTLTFKAGEDVVKTESLEYGATIVAPAEPEKEGYTFSGWGSFPETMPAHDLEVKGSYTINTYKVTFLIDDVEFQSMELEYGATIVAPEVVAPEGYTFSGWGEVPATMPAHDVEINGTYTANIYKVIFKIGDDIISEEEVAFNTTITVPDAPEKEGYTFSGWGEVPATMPARDLVFEGSYMVNTYTATFKIGEDVISEEQVEYGAAITVPDAPEKEGYTFAGWGEVPATMPAGDIVIEGSYTVNS